MNKTKTVEELIKVILEDFHFTKSLDDGPYGISEQWLEEKIQAVFTAAKEEGRREEREELLKELPKKKYINFNSEGMNSITGFNNCLDQVKQLLKAPRSI